MATLTSEEIQAIHSKCSNDWRLNRELYIFHQEKALIKQIDIDNENYTEFTIRYNSKRQIILTISRYYHKQNRGMPVTSGAYKKIMLEEKAVKRKNINNLIAFTGKLTESKLLELEKSKETEVKRILQSE